jgi:hypothetical protein
VVCDPAKIVLNYIMKPAKCLTSAFLATWEMEIWKIIVQGQPDMNSQTKSLRRPILTNKKLGVVASIRHPSYMGSINRRTVAQAGPGKHKTLLEK